MLVETYVPKDPQADVMYPMYCKMYHQAVDMHKEAKAAVGRGCSASASASARASASGPVWWCVTATSCIQ